MKRRRKPSMPSMLFWNRRDQANFIANVERLGGVLNDIERVLEPAKRKKKAAVVNGTAAAVGFKGDAALVEAKRLLQGYVKDHPGLDPHFTSLIRQIDIVLNFEGGDA